MKHVIVTGANGFLGQQLVSHLSNQDSFCISQIDLPAYDLTSPDTFSLSPFSDFDIVYLAHALNPTQNTLTSDSCANNLIESFNVNVLSIYLLLQHIASSLQGRENPIKIIHLSSIYSVRSPKHYIYKNQLKPASYGCTKSAANYLIKHYSLLYPSIICGVNLIIGGVQSGREDAEFVQSYSSHAPTGSMVDSKMLVSTIADTANFLTPLSAGSDIYLDGGWTQW